MGPAIPVKSVDSSARSAPSEADLKSRGNRLYISVRLFARIAHDWATSNSLEASAYVQFATATHSAMSKKWKLDADRINDSGVD
ncbi:hypothetical protein GCM10016455_25400 [Aliiroseovarius zhejiangensis]|uniref:Uncharacterized protein n=1 Tax=Aliiroseovarius zhejiangensis TaxID=1632025 RepID=A0ABQ3J591_9RHOB|nr:hypothetical protein GCM10016455_25400 [Aliiroseovarius zhejiangensis]